VKRRVDRSVAISICLGLLAFALDRIHKFIQVSADCMGLAVARCVDQAQAVAPAASTGWRGGEYVPVTNFFDYVLVWNKGISYGLLTAVPVQILGALMAIAIVALCVWWTRAQSLLIRSGLALCIGGAVSNAADRWIYGGVADFFHFHWQEYSFYIFNVADTMITLGVGLLILDMLGVGRRKTA